MAVPALRGAVEPVRRLALLGLASAVLYGIGITARYPLMTGLLEPRGTWVTLVGASWGALGAHIGVYAALTVLYVLALHTARSLPDGAQTRRVIVGVWLTCSVLLLGAYPGGESHDIFDYLFRGRMMAELGASPLAIAPNQFSRAPYYLYISWHGHVDTYGPLWEYTSATVAVIVRAVLQGVGLWFNELPSCPDEAASCNVLAAYVTGYRLLAIGMAGLTGALLYGIVRRVRPADAPAALVAWLWSPILLMGTALGAHNDIVMLALMGGVFSLFQQRHYLLGLLALVLAVHVKLTALLVAPVIAVWLLIKVGWRRAGGYSVVALAIAAPLSWLLYMPLGGWATLPRMLNERTLFVAASPANVVYRWLYDTQGWGAPDAREAVQQGATLFFAGVALVLLGLMWRELRHTTEEAVLWRTSCTVTLAYLLIGSFWFQHWYVLWALAPAALLPGSMVLRLILPWYSFGALSANIAGNMLATLVEPLPNRLTLAMLDALIIVAPLVVVLLANTSLWCVQRLRQRSVLYAKRHEQIPRS
jgi:hypothetical protein